MKKGSFYVAITIVIVLGLISASWFIYSVRKEQTGGKEEKTTPTTNNGAKWRIGYYEGGPYINYRCYLEAVVTGLIELGWIEDQTLPEYGDSEETKDLWSFLATNLTSNYIQFVSDAYWSANWNTTLRTETKASALQRLASGRDIDLVLAMGTWAGLDLANNNHSVPTFVLSTTDPIGLGIIKSAEDSGFDHVIAKCEPGRYIRQIRLFHDLVGFKKIGVVYEDTDVGRAYANLQELQTVAAERGFEIVEAHAQDTGLTDEECKAGIIEAYQNIAPEIDALWIGAHRGESLKNLPEILTPMFDHNVTTWSSQGASYVKRGALLSISRIDYDPIGSWCGEIIAKIFNGIKPRDLNPVFEIPYKIVINREAARRIGFEIPNRFLDIADESYDTVESGAIV